MINDLDIVQWGYLLDPAFQLINSAGKPLTNGYIEVYYHGTRNKYYCASDFDGTLHPFKIPLDSLGSNIVLADPGYSYDIYIYNAFGSLVMSRYNVTPGKGGEGSGGGTVPGSEMPEHWLGMYGSSIQIPGTGAGTTLPVPTGNDVDYEGDFIDHIEDNKYIYLKEGLYLVECVIRFEQSSSDLKNELGEVLVYTGRGNANEDRAWQEDLSGPDANGNRHCLKMSFIRLVQDGTHHGDSSVLYFAPGSPVNWSWAQIQNLSIVKLEAGGGAAYKYLPGDYITIDNRTISVTGLLPESATAQFVTSDTLNETVTNIYNDIDYVSAAVQDCISGGVTHGELIAVSSVIEGDVQIVSAALNEVSAAIPEAQVNADWNATSGKAEILNKPDLSVYATHDELENVSGTLDDKIDAVSAAVPEAQVNADWNAVSGKAEILNKPDLTVYATHDEVAGVSSTIVNNIEGDLVTVSTVLEGDIQTVSAALDSVTAPEYQAGEGIDITDDTISLDNPIYIEAGSGITFTATEDSITISADAPDLSNYATHDEVSAVVGAVSSVIEGDISAVSTEIMNIVEGVSATIEGDIQSVSTTIEGDISSVSTVLQNNIEGVSATIVNNIEGDLVTVSTVLEGDIQTVSAALDAVTSPEYQAGEGIDITDDTISLDDPISIEAGQGITFSASGDTITISADAPDLSNYATHDEVSGVVGSVSSVIENDIQTVSTVLETVSANMPEPQVNSDWAAVSGVAEILNKPQNVDVIAGPGIQFTEVSGNIVISSTVSGDVTIADLEGVTAQLEGDIQTVSSAIPDVSNLATKDELQAVSSAIPDISNLATEADLQIVSAAIPEYVGDNGVSVSGETISLDDPIGIVAGEGVTFTQDGDDIIISAEGDVSKADLAAVSGQLEGDIQTVSSAIPDVSNFATEADLQTVSGLVEIVSAKLPTTEIGKFTIPSNVTGGPIDVMVPTDQAPDSVFYQINSVSGTAYTNSNGYAVINYYYGETPADFNGSDDAILFTINDSISNINYINFYYVDSESSMGGPNLSPTAIDGGSTGTVQSGTYKVKAQYNQAGTSSNYGKYLEIMFGWRSYASDAAQSLQWAQAALSKITFFGVVRPDPAQGVIVNLNRYYLGNTVSTSTPNSDLACQVTVDDVSKQQKAYLPSGIPSSWKSDIITSLQYGSNYNNPSYTTYTFKQYRAYKYTSSPRRYQYAYCTDCDAANKVMTFIAYDNSGNAIEKWTLDYNNYSSNVWTTSPIASTQVNADWDAVSGVAEILNKPTETDVIAGEGITITETAQGVVISSTASGDVTMQDLVTVSGQLESDIQTVSAAIPDISNLATESELQTVSGVIDAVSAAIPGAQVQSDWTETDDTKKSYIQHKPSAKTLIAGSNITISESVSGVTINANGAAVADLVAVSGNLEADIQTVSAAIPPAQVNANWNESSSSSKAYIQNKPTTLAPFNTAGITDIQYVNALPANPVSSVIYIIPET